MLKRLRAPAPFRYRLGASGPVKVTRLVAKGTVEEALLNLTAEEERRRRLGTFMAARQSDAGMPQTLKAMTLNILKDEKFLKAPLSLAGGAAQATKGAAWAAGPASASEAGSAENPPGSKGAAGGSGGLLGDAAHASSSEWRAAAEDAPNARCSFSAAEGKKKVTWGSRDIRYPHTP